MTTREMVLSALFVALITVGTFVRIPIGGDVFTLQFLFTLLAGLLLGKKTGTASVGAYVLMGLMGIPVFASGGGPGYALQPTFGYLVGFMVQAWFCGKFSRRLKTINLKGLLTVNLGGMAIVYLFGVTWFHIVTNYVLNTPISLWMTFFYCVVLQIIPDVILCAAAAMLAVRCKKAGLWL